MISATQSNHPLAGVSATTSKDSVQDACDTLRKAGLRITRPRVALLNALVKHSEPVAIEPLHAELSSESCDLVTVYRCLAAFERVGIVHRSFKHNGTSLYELQLTDRPKHYHIACKSCGKLEPVDYFPIEGVERVLRARGYSELSHLVEFFGICPACQQKTAGNRVAESVE